VERVRGSSGLGSGSFRFKKKKKKKRGKTHATVKSSFHAHRSGGGLGSRRSHSRVPRHSPRKSAENRRKRLVRVVSRGGEWYRAAAERVLHDGRGVDASDSPGKDHTSNVYSSAFVMGPSHPPFCNPTISSASPAVAAAASEIWKRSEVITEA